MVGWVLSGAFDLRNSLICMTTNRIYVHKNIRSLICSLSELFSDYKMHLSFAMYSKCHLIYWLILGVLPICFLPFCILCNKAYEYEDFYFIVIVDFNMQNPNINCWKDLYSPVRMLGMKFCLIKCHSHAIICLHKSYFCPSIVYILK